MLVALIPFYLTTVVDKFALVDDKEKDWIGFDVRFQLNDIGEIISGDVCQILDFVVAYYTNKQENVAFNLFLASESCKKRWEILFANIDFDLIIKDKFPSFADSFIKYKLIS